MLGKITSILAVSLVLAATVWAGIPTAYIINTTAETLSKIDLNTGTVTNNILTLGSDIYCFPNQIVIRDTLAYVLNSGTDEIQIIDLNTEATVGWIDFATGSNPYWMAFLDDQYLYVTLLVDNSLAKVDLSLNQVIKTTGIGQSPEGVVILDGKAYVAVTAYDFSTYSWGQGKVVVYDTETDNLTDDEILTPINPQFLDLDRRGFIHCVCTGNYFDVEGQVVIVEPSAARAVDTLELGGIPGQITIGPNNVAWVAAGGWVSAGEVYAYNALSSEVYHDASNPHLVDSGATSVAAFQDSSAFILTFADIVSRYDISGSQLGSYNLGDGPSSLDFNYVPGDANGDWLVNVGDAVYLVNHIFHNGPKPLYPAWRGDVNADGYINVGDAVYLIGHIFKETAPPRLGMTWLR